MGIIYQNCLKIGSTKSKVDCAKFQDYLVLLIRGSCSSLVFLHVYQILHTHSLPFARSWSLKLMNFYFSPVPIGDNRVLEAKRTSFSSRHGWCIILFLFLSKLGIYLQNLIPGKSVEHWENQYFPQWGMLKFTKKGRFGQYQSNSSKF
jgi:hypothetical protein